jgi:phosphoglycolate phosphatase
VGPPLRDTFFKFGVPSDRLDEAVAVYRGRYIPIGKYENHPYPGIRELLETLKNQGHRLYVATSKPEGMSIDILKHFQLFSYFDLVCGSSMDGVRDKKSEVIAYLLEQIGAAPNAVMVGDTAFDIIGAAAHGIPGIGVSWGYGNVREMRDAGAIAIANNPEELLTLINR